MANPRNFSHAVEGDELVIRINIGKEAQADARTSNTGKSLILGESGGFLVFDDVDVGEGLSLYVTATVGVCQKKQKKAA